MSVINVKYPEKSFLRHLRRPGSAVSSPGRISSYIATGFPPFSLLVANVWSRQRERPSSTIRLGRRLPRGTGNPAEGDFHSRGNRLAAPTSAGVLRPVASSLLRGEKCYVALETGLRHGTTLTNSAHDQRYRHFSTGRDG